MLPRSADPEVSDHEEEDGNGTMMEDVQLRRKMTTSVASNVQRCLVLGTRSISKKDRHLIHDFYKMLPHSRGHNKVKIATSLPAVMTELCDMHHCNTSLLLDARKRGTTMWIGQAPEGPSAAFTLRNVATTAELRMTGNALKHSRPILHFDYEFSTSPHLRVVQTLLSMVFGTPKDHPKAKPFIDHIYCFFFHDGHIWFRNYQIIANGAKTDLIEIGPRFVLYPLVLLDGYCSGSVLWKNPVPVSTAVPGTPQDRKADAYRIRMDAKKGRLNRDATLPPIPMDDPLNAIFQ